MLKKSHALALAVTTAGLIGISAPMASAATMAPGHHHQTPGSSVVNVSGNQVPVQACGNDVDGNILGGQVPVQGAALVGSLLSPGSTTTSTATDNRGCNMANNSSSTGDSPGSSVVNVANNQVPVQACGNDVLVNGAGGQVPLEGIAGALSVLSSGAVTSATATDNRGCNLLNNQGW
ncbi:MAG: hypothetical protein ACRDNW_09515 [Trebonia sp.]